MWIKNRINAEHRKHKNLDWAMIAEQKILSNISYLIDEEFALEFGKNNSEVYLQKRLRERIVGVKRT